MEKIKKWMACLLIMAMSLTHWGHVSAQNLTVRNVRFEKQGNRIIVNYDLVGERNKKHNITLSLSDDYGKTYKILPKSLAGNIGKNVKSGRERQIVWFYKRDYPEGLPGEGYVFAVDAELQTGGSKAAYYIIGAGVIGGILYLATQSGKKAEPSEPTTGGISITIIDEL